MMRPFRTIIALMLSVALAWLPMQSAAAMSDRAPQDGSSRDGSALAQQAVPCHSAMAKADTAGDAAAIGSTHVALSKTAKTCCCDGCDSSCDSGCVQGGNMAVLSSGNRISADKHHAFQVNACSRLSGLTYSPAIPPPLV